MWQSFRHPPLYLKKKKMAEFSVIMSDNAAPATCTSRLVTAYIRELKEAGFTEEQLGSMSQEQRLDLCRTIEYGCKAHAGCLLVKEMVSEEDLVMKEFAPDAEHQQRMDYKLSSLLHAISKEFLPGINQYAKGHSQEFLAYMQINYPSAVKVNSFREVGSRMWTEFESCHRVNFMVDPFINFLVQQETVRLSEEQSKLSSAIKNRLGNRTFRVAMAVRGMFWISLFSPLRVLTNSHDLGILTYT